MEHVSGSDFFFGGLYLSQVARVNRVTSSCLCSLSFSITREMSDIRTHPNSSESTLRFHCPGCKFQGEFRLTNRRLHMGVGRSCTISTGKEVSGGGDKSYLKMISRPYWPVSEPYHRFR